MKLYLILLIALLTGCSTTVPVTAKFPNVPEELKEKCSDLKKIEGEQISIIDLHKTVIENYTIYHECVIKVEGWNEWYVKQKEIFETIK